MAEGTRFPQVPANVWWGVRDLIARNPRVTLDAGNLAALLNVQPTAARQYANELQQLNVLDDKFRPTELASQWRTEEHYEKAKNDILLRAYPEALLALAQPEAGNRQIIERWFVSQGLGSGTAKNKASTYLLVGGPPPSESKKATPDSAPTSRPARNTPSKSSKEKSGRSDTPNSPKEGRRVGPEMMPLNVNIQIHISADASTDQINAIFMAMKQYLHDDS